MENKISDLENYTLKPKNSNEEPVKRCKFYYLQDDYLWKEFDVEGHYDLESAFDLAKNIMTICIIIAVSFMFSPLFANYVAQLDWLKKVFLMDFLKMLIRES